MWNAGFYITEQERESRPQAIDELGTSTGPLVISKLNLMNKSGVQPGPGRFTVLAYGADADRLWASLEPAVRPLPYRPAEVTLRYGPVGAPDRVITL